jgi:hypothetical protein
MKGLNYLRQKGNLVEIQGGSALTWTVNTSSSPNTQWYTGDQALPIASLNNNLYTAAVDWKFLDDALVLNFTDLIINDGSPDAIANQAMAQLDITKMSAIQGLASAWIANTVNINPLAIDGLLGAVDNATVLPTYAGINRSSSGLGSLFQGNVNYNTTGANNILNDLQALDLTAQIDASRPDFYMSNRLAYGAMIQKLTALDRYIQPDLARTFGATDLAFNGNPVFIDNNVPTGVASPQAGVSGTGGYVLGLNSRYINMIVHPQVNFEVEEWQKAQNNNTYFTRVHFAGNLAVLKPPAHFNLWSFGN